MAWYVKNYLVILQWSAQHWLYEQETLSHASVVATSVANLATSSKTVNFIVPHLSTKIIQI